MVKKFNIHSRSQIDFIDITLEILKSVEESNTINGFCYIFIPHTTASVTINENADPDVVFDIKKALEKIVPFEENYKHLEGNSAAHIKASLMGSSEIIFIESGKLVLGTWQGIYFCEFDGPRTRNVLIKIT